MSTPSVRQLLRHYDLEPKRSLSQNFLVDENHLRAIADAADLTHSDVVLEIGPGLGVLTRYLAERAGRVVAVELDDRLVPILRDRFTLQEPWATIYREQGVAPPVSDNVIIVHADILQHEPAALIWPSGGKTNGDAEDDYQVVANLPYGITSAVLRHLLEAERAPQCIVVLVQREVAERICAEPGDMSLLAVSVQFYATPQIVHHVPASAFYPRPKVDSAVLRLDVHAQPAALEALPDAALSFNRAQFFRVVKAGFSQRRKQLLNSLAGGLALPKPRVEAALHAAAIEPQRRAQTLSLAEWVRLYAAFDWDADSP